MFFVVLGMKNSLVHAKQVLYRSGILQSLEPGFNNRLLTHKLIILECLLHLPSTDTFQFSVSVMIMWESSTC
jgi:hypothetical protein